MPALQMMFIVYVIVNFRGVRLTTKYLVTGLLSLVNVFRSRVHLGLRLENNRLMPEFIGKKTTKIFRKGGISSPALQIAYFFTLSMACFPECLRFFEEMDDEEIQHYEAQAYESC